MNALACAPPIKPLLAAPLLEISTSKASRLLNISPTTLREARWSQNAGKLLRWRFSSDKKGKILWEVASLHAYRASLISKNYL